MYESIEEGEIIVLGRMRKGIKIFVYIIAVSFLLKKLG